ncbi:hypothetical protein PENSPDRAFT_485993 [Peniophora sp. CONT]|nr:hypothetical protein PENSPDRAFT_485993 [Peniophora sp. CONT]
MKSANSSARSRAADLQALQDRISNSFPKGHPTEEHSDRSASDMSMSDGDGNTDIGSEDTGELLRELNARDHSTVSQIANGTQNTTALRSMAFGGHMRNDSDLLEADSEMQRAMGAMDSFDTEQSRNERPISFPPARPAKSPGLGARPLAMLGRAGSLTENQLTGNSSRRVSGELSRRHSADVESLASTSQPGTPERNRPQHQRNSYSHSGGSPLPGPRSRRSSIVSLRDNDLSNGSSIGSMGDLRDRLRGERSEQDHDRERSWNRPNASASSAFLRQRMSFPPRSGSSLSSHSTHSTPDRSQHSSRAPTPDPEEIHEREFNWNNPRPEWTHSRTRTLSGDLGPPGSPSQSQAHTLPPRSRTQSTSSLTHARRPSSSLSTNSSISSRASSPDPEKERIREHNWNNPSPNWNRPPPRRSVSPLPPTPSSSARPRANSSVSYLSAITPDRPTSRSSSPVPPGSNDKQHTRERNWGSHTPNWSSSTMHASRRSMSPLPPNGTPSPRPSPSHARVRTQSFPSKPISPSPNSRAGGSRSGSSLGVEPPAWPVPPSPPRPNLNGRRDSAPAKSAAREALAKIRDNGKEKDTSTTPVHSRKEPSSSSAKPSGIPKPGAARTNGNGKNGSALGSIAGWSFPRKDVAREPDSDLESVSSRSPSPVHVSGRGQSHIPVRSPGKIQRAERHVPGTPAEDPPSSIFRRGHKRASTEFAEANGGVPPKIVVEESDFGEEEEVRASLEEMSMSGGLEPLRESDEDSNTPVLRPVVIPEVEEVSGSEAPTPTQAEPVSGFEHEPASEVESENESEGQPQSEGESMSEEPPEQVQLFASTTPDTTPAFVDVNGNADAESPSSPSTPPPAHPPSFSDLVTPPRRPSLFHTPAKPPSPSPSKGLPDLPPPPSDDEGEDPTPPPTQPNFSLMKTPRPPGGWISTPAPAPPPRPASTEPPSNHTNGRARSNSTGSPAEPAKGVLKTPAASNRANTLPSRTPAPPGGWINTPAATDRRKSVMKVRFEAPGSEVEGGDETEREDGPLPAPVFDASWSVVNAPSNGHVKGSEQWGDAVGEASLSEPSFAGVVSSSPVVRDAAKENQEPTTPATERLNKVRKSPSVRLMDEYGREKSLDPAAAAGQEKEAAKEKVKAARLEKERVKAEERERQREKERDEARERERDKERDRERELEKERIRQQQQAVKERERSLRMPGGTLQTPRSKSSVRMLDAMGREVEDDEPGSDSTITETRMTRSQAIERMRRAVSELREGLDSADIDSSDERVEDARLAQLHEISQSARAHRDRLAASLRQAQEQKGKTRVSIWSRLTPKAISARQLLWISFTVFFAQCLLALYIYRLSHQHARDTYLSTYFDPFHPDLYLNPVQPNKLRREPPVSSGIVHTTLSSMSAAVQRAWRTRSTEQSGSWPPT